MRSGEAIWTQLGDERRCVVLFTDLVGFTRSSTLEPPRCSPCRYFKPLGARSEGTGSAGQIHRGLSDGGIWRYPHRGDKEEALAAVGLPAMRDNLKQLNAELQLMVRPLRGIGLHFGEVMAGNPAQATGSNTP